MTDRLRTSTSSFLHRLCRVGIWHHVVWRLDYETLFCSIKARMMMPRYRELLSHVWQCECNRLFTMAVKGHLLYFREYLRSGRDATLGLTACVENCIGNSHFSLHNTPALAHMITLLIIVQTISYEGQSPLLHLMLVSMVIKQCPILQRRQRFLQ